MLGDGRLIKRRLRDGEGDSIVLPIICIKQIILLLVP